MRKKLCSKCKTGLESYELDKTSCECPYILLHDGKKCIMFVKADNKMIKKVNRGKGRSKNFLARFL